ncbi:MAG: hypothetical protein M1825_005178 [Sarcosagium campestre]|nr:MAG: hypothetical protein M1825_005178 [Sarcosagium campestre]
MTTEDDQSETSPLLRNSKASTVKIVVANGASRTLSGDLGAPAGGVRDTSDAERQSVDGRNYDGMPDVQAKFPYIMPALAIGVLLSAADQTIIVSSYGRIGSDLNALNNTSWIATAYFLTLTSFQPLYGKLSDIFGRKPALLFAYAVFGIGCLFCGLARNMNELIAARAFAGIGGGGMTTVVSILLSDVIPLRNRGTWQGYINIIYASGAGIGAPLGGTLADTIGWRWSFIGQAPLTLIAFISVYLTLELPQNENADWKTKLKRVDFLGALTLVVAVFTLLLGLDRGSNVSWRLPLTLISLGASLALFIIFIFIEVKIATEPFAPGHIIFERSLFACYLCNFFSFGGYLATLFYLPLYFQAVDGLSASQAGVRLLPGIAAGVSGSLFAGVWMKRTGRYYWLTVTAYTFLTVGVVPMLLFTGLVSRSIWGIWASLVICGFSNGIGVTSSLIALISNATTQDQAVATACSYLFRSLGSVVGISLSATVVQQSLRMHLRAALNSGRDADHIVKKVRQSLEYIKTLEPGVRDIVRDCYGNATQAGFLLQLCIVAGAMVSAFWIREKKLSR